MCGICGKYYFERNKEIQEIEIKPMMAAMKHRGPDDDGILLHKNIGLGFVRLSILDLSKLGRQPMLSDDGRYVIVFNGEIYNYIEIRNLLLKKNYSFKSRTDTEVLLKAYIEFGDDVLNMLNGMFSFIILDKKTKNIFGARDRYGIKPFYYYQNKDFFTFASDIKSILSDFSISRTANNQAIFNYLVFNRTDYSNETFFNGINKLPHGHKIRIENGKIKISRWYNISENTNKPFLNKSDFLNTFNSSLELRMRSDVLVGACLSGGLDSSSIVASLTKSLGYRDLHTFSAVYKTNSKENELPYINEFSSSVYNMHYTYPDNFSLLNDLDDLFKTHSEPFSTPGIYAQYKVMQLAKEHVTVLLDGQGADEYLAGYDYFYAFNFREIFTKLKWLLFIKEVFGYLKVQNNHKQLLVFLYLMLPSMYKTKLRGVEKSFVNNDFFNTYKKNNTISSGLYGSKGILDASINHFEYKLEHLLKWEDTNSMRFSIESRVPFLDHRLVEGVISLQNRYKIHKGWTKHILRDQLSHIVPSKISKRREKIGFATPADSWFRTKRFNDLIMSIIDSDKFEKRGIIDVNKAKKLYTKHLNNEINIANDIWKWINLENWFRIYIDK